MDFKRSGIFDEEDGRVGKEFAQIPLVPRSCSTVWAKLEITHCYEVIIDHPQEAGEGAEFPQVNSWTNMILVQSLVGRW